MTKYEMQRDTDKVWTTTLQFFTYLYAQRKAYGNNRAANSAFDSAALVPCTQVPPPGQSNRTVASTTSGITSRDLYIESLKEPLAAIRKYVARERAPAMITNLTALLCTELEAQRKHFNLIMKQNADILTTMAKNGGGSNGRGGSGGGGDGGGSGSGNRGCGG